MSRRNLVPYAKKAGLVFVVLLLAVLIKGLISSILSTVDKSQALKSLEQQAAQKKQQQAYLTQKLYIVKTDSFVEQEARKLGLVREGEQIVADTKIEPVKPQVVTQSLPNWQKWWNLFF